MDYQRYFKGIYGKREVSSDLDYYMPIPISALISSRDSHICPEVSAKGRYGPRDDIRADRASVQI
jgi:hypothetical protein